MEVSVDQVEFDLEELPPALFQQNHQQKSSTKRNYAWLSKLTQINLDLCGSDLSQRIELSSSNGHTFKTEETFKWNEAHRLLPDQKQFSILNNRNEKLLTLDFSKDRKSFHIMEPDSSVFIGFFTMSHPLENSQVRIHNVIDEEVYLADASISGSPYHVQIKSEKGEEMGTISRPPPKWTQILAGTLVLNFTGDERDGLTTREKAILLGFLIALGIVGMDYWKASTTGIMTLYILIILVFSAAVIYLYLKYRHGGGVRPTAPPNFNKPS